MRTRYAPSPTGLLHVGGLRTALYNYLVARQTNGAFLLRIEDTDQEREVVGATENILSSLAWAGMVPDEGVVLKDGIATQIGDKGPYIQSQRLELYREHAQKLLESGHAYRCFCTKERLDQMRKDQEAKHLPPMYDRHCKNLSAEESAERAKTEPHVLRMAVPDKRTVEFNDAIRGTVKFESKTIDDQVLMKSDGFPTYHLANVVDDHMMQIDLVLRGEEWLSSTPKHILLYEAFGWSVPQFGHVPLLLNKDKSKLSKRQGSVSVQEYIDQGYLPEAMLNFLAMLGWNSGTEQDIFSLQDLIDQFSLDRVQKAGAIFDMEKLNWLQGQWMRKIPAKEFAKRIRPLVEDKYPQANTDDRFEERAILIQERLTFFHEAPDMLGYFYTAPTVSVELLASAKQKITADMLPQIFTALDQTLVDVAEESWTMEHLEKILREACTTHNLKLGQLLWPLRAALTGREYSPGAFEVAFELGKAETMKRLAAAKAIV